MIQLNGKIALVTGAARRTGRVLAMGLAQRGAHVAVHYRGSREEAEQTVADLRVPGWAVQADLTRPSEVEAMVDGILQRFGRIDILINNVGTFHVQPIRNVSADDWRATLETTVTSTFIASQAVLPHMERQGQGRIVNLADSGADKLSPQPTLTAYMVGKTGVLILTRSLAAAYAGTDITVNCVSPGILHNSVTKPPGGPAAIPKGRYASNADLLHAVLFFLDDDAGYVTGENLKVAGGWQL